MNPRGESRGESRDDPQSPIRVTHVVFDFDGGGLETLVAEMAARFRGTSVIVSLVSLSGRVGRLGERTRDRFDQFHVVKPKRGITMLFPLGVAAAIRATKADVVHVHNASWFKGARAARLAGVRRIVYTEHGREHFDPWRNRVLDRVASYSTHAVVAVSERLERYLENTVGIARSRLCTIHNGVDTDRFTTGARAYSWREGLGIPPDALVVGSVGRLEAVKAYDRLLDAAASLRSAGAPPFYVVLAGDGSQRDALRERASRLGVSDMVRLIGWTQETVDFYRQLDVFVLCSVSEGQSVSLMEAMACGIAPVLTDVGGNVEMAGPGLATQIVPAEGDVVGGLRSVLGATLADPRARQSMAAEVRRRAVDFYSLERMTANYERVYRSPSIPVDLRASSR